MPRARKLIAVKLVEAAATSAATVRMAARSVLLDTVPARGAKAKASQP